MPEHFRALAFILTLTLPIFFAARAKIGPGVIARADFNRRFGVWLGVLLCAFLPGNYWAYILASGALMDWAALCDRNPLALFLGLMFVVPPITTFVPGFGSISYFFEINHLRLASITILGVAYIRLMRDGTAERFGSFLLDWLVLAYLLLQLVLLTRTDPTATAILRTMFELFVDGYLPYTVASRGVRHLPAVREAMASLLLAIMLTAPVALFELSKNWLLYAGLTEALGLSWEIMPYIMRDGNVRPIGPAGISLVFGYVLAMGVCLYACARAWLPSRVWIASYALLAAGLFASMARGSYVGAVVAVLIVAGTGQGAGQRVAKLLLLAAVLAVGVAFSPFADKVLGYLPFVGDVDVDNVTYRKILFDVSLQVISLNPFFGSSDFMQNPMMEQLRQGQGLIDIVNSYLGVALGSGYVGLGLYLSIFGTALVMLVKSIARSAGAHAELELLGRSLLGALIGTMIIIATASTILSMPFLIWIALGLSVRCHRLVMNSSYASPESPARGTLQTATRPRTPSPGMR